ncbi:hypothetical protein GCM10011380_00560 [Sphingomonas metalli]|uniref:DUF2184 domain-containing protein n=1 Tax=Sphingomonas metalli TaxID=1779358 RepID=A0A916WNN9_9SPHN|nr:DUF2184 domain-containing protein [Sphingomonas metalli]GGB15035.1 hypothetical protein GCM10011380_00560 [Sphingomonas metalli]
MYAPNVIYLGDAARAFGVAPTLDISDAQQSVGFAQPALFRTHRMLPQKYPSFDYAGLVPVNTDGDMWDVGTLVYSGDVAGKAEYLGGKAFDVPNASINFTQGVTPFHLAGVGYELSRREVERFARMVAQNPGITEGGSNLAERKASAARMVADKFVYDRVIRGSGEKGFLGMINQTAVPTANAPNGSWATATATAMRADVDAALTDVYVNSRETALANSLLLPTTKFLQINRAVMDNTGTSVLNYLRQNNAYTAITNQPLDIRPSRELENAGASNTARMIAYEKSPDNMEFFLPGVFEFMPLFATSSMTWRVDGVMNVGQFELYRPKTMSYRDNI